MKNRILIWPRSNLIYFGMAKYLQENHDCKLFIAIDNNNISKEFFLKQDIVKFEKIWFYGDYINNSFEKADIKYLKEFEERYGINLWNLAYSDRIFFKHNPYFFFDRDRILAIMQYSCKFFESIIKDSKPEFLIMDPSAFHQDVILERMCKIHGIKILTMFTTRFGNKMAISSKVDSINATTVKNTTNEKKSFDDLKNYVKGYSSQQKIFFKKSTSTYKRRIIAGLNFILFLDNKRYTSYFPNYGKTRLKIISSQLSILIKRKFRENFFNKHSVIELKANTKFAYFPLHYQPERSTLIAAPYYVDQLEVIKCIAKSLPIDFTLYVKEHPLMRVHGWRPISFYKKIQDLPNAKMVHISVPNEEIVDKCSLVITITGSSGLEAAFYEKPSIIFADVIYSNLASVYRIKNIEELPKAIKESLKKKVDLDSLNNYVKLVEENSFDMDYPGFFREILQIFRYDGFSSKSNVSVPKMKEYIEKRKELFEKLAFEYVKKIKHN